MSFVSVKTFNGNIDNYINNLGTTSHFLYDRLERINRVENLEDTLKVDHSFIVDKRHRNGLEIHVVTEDGMIYIYNKNSRKLVTVLIARPNQIKRLYDWCNLVAPKHIIEKARIHQMNNENY